jgi:hypothetical protein
MTLDLAPGTAIQVDGYPYTVEDHSTFHDVDFRLDLVRLSGPTPAHERWLVAVLPEPYLMLMQRLRQEWLAPPVNAIVHDGELFENVYQGGGHRLMRMRTSKTKDGRVEYALFRANSGRVILTINHNDAVEAWVGVTLPPDAVQLPKGSATN